MSNYSTILALDQSTSSTGYSVFRFGKIIESGTLRSHVGIKENNFHERINDMGEQINKLAKRINPSVVVIEDVQFQRNYGVYKRLANLQGVIYAYLYQLNIPCFTVEVTKWKTFFGVKSRGRVNQKQETRELVNKIYGLIVQEDEADAIGIGHWASHHLNFSPI